MNGGFPVQVPALTGCTREGDRIEARRVAVDAFRAYGESWVAAGEPSPPEVPELPRHGRVEVRLARAG